MCLAGGIQLLHRLSNGLSDLISVALAVLVIYTAGFGVFDNIWFSGLTVAFGMTIVLLRSAGTNTALLWVHLIIGALFLGLSWVWLGIMLEQEEFFINITRQQLMMGWVAFALIGYVTWRSFGVAMLAVYLGMAVYVLWGADEHWSRVAENLWYSTDGVYGRPVEVVGRIVLVFIVFGAVLQTSGAGSILLKLAFAATGRMAGGPAHASVVGSALFGTMSGAAVANVVSTGVFTIPIIKKAGFKPRFAGAVEAAASTGGQIMPPVMGVVAFIMADVTNIPYLKIVVAATLPAMMYYTSLFMVVTIEARRLNIGATPPENRQQLTPRDWVQSLAFFVPLALIVLVLTTGRTAQNAGYFALIAAFVMSFLLFPAFRNPKKWWDALVEAGRTAATLMVIVAAVGFVIGVINMTGVGLKLAQMILSFSGTSLLFSLLLVMLGCLIMGMGVPSVTAYLILAIVMGPALEKLGVPTIAAHLFMLYFGVLSVVTPPVALAAFAAAPIAGAKPMETGFTALRLAIAGFIIPFLFVYHPDVLIINGFSIAGLFWAILIFAVSTWMIATGLGRYQNDPIPFWNAGLRVVTGLVVLHPQFEISAFAAIIAVILTAHHWNSRQRGNTLREEHK